MGFENRVSFFVAYFDVVVLFSLLLCVFPVLDLIQRGQEALKSTQETLKAAFAVFDEVRLSCS